MIKKYLIVLSYLFLVLGLNVYCQKKANKIVRKSPKDHDFIEAKKYTKTKKLDTQLCIIIQMNMHSGLKRAFITDLKKYKNIDSFMVSHGCGKNSWGNDNSKDNPQFSNEDGSHLSSIGKYKIGERGHSQWGINVKYLLFGLESTNSNALKRTIVLHSWDDVTDNEIYPNGTAEGWGCPAVSNKTMKKLDSIIQKHPRMLLWIKN